MAWEPSGGTAAPENITTEEMAENSHFALGTIAPEAGTLKQESRRGLHRVVWMLAWPTVLTMLLQTLNSFVDRFFVGHLGSDALAAAGVGGQMMFLLFSVGMSIGVGTTALVARFTGAQELGEAKIAANQSVWIAGLASVVCIAIAWPTRGLLLRALGVDQHAAGLADQYLAITILGTPFTFVMLALSSVFRGLGDTVRPLLISILANVVHLVGDWLLIFGHGGFPKMGLSGGAVAMTVSTIVASLAYLAFLPRTQVAGMMAVRRHLEMEWARRILNIGVPALWQNLSRILSMMAFTGVLARTPEATAAVAALTIGLTAEGIAYMPGFGFSVAASTLTGQNLGARNPKRAEAAAWTALQQGLAVMIVMGIVFYVFAVPFAHLFSHDPEVVRLTALYLRIAALSEPFLAFGMILNGALNGAGDTKAPAWVAVITMWGVRLPLGILLAHTLHGGTPGAWWAMSASTMLSGIGALLLFKHGAWKKTVV